MTVTLDLDPDLDETLRSLARAKGVSVEQYLRSLIAQVVRGRSDDAALELLREWKSEDATEDAEELARRERDWEAFREAMNRSHSSDRTLFPCPE